MTGVRRVVASLALVALLVTAGCSFLEGPVTFEANQSTVSQQALDETGYDEERVEEQTVTREFGVGDQTQEVQVVNQIAEYKRQVSLGPLDGELARFSVFTTPQVEVAGQQFNPVDDMSNEELAQMVQDEYETVNNVEHVDDRTATMLGEQVEVSRFSADAQTAGGQSVQVYIHIGQVQHGDDYVVVIAVHPQELDEQANVDRLMEGVEHDTAE